MQIQYLGDLIYEITFDSGKPIALPAEEIKELQQGIDAIVQDIECNESTRPLMPED